MVKLLVRILLALASPLLSIATLYHDVADLPDTSFDFIVIGGMYRSYIVSFELLTVNVRWDGGQCCGQ